MTDINYLPRIPIDRATYERARIQAEKERARKHRHEMKTGRTHHDSNYEYMHEWPFVMWDGEATDKGYCLFGNSLGEEICEPGLTTNQCFNLMLKSKKNNPHRIDMIFGGRYDFSEICRQSIPEARLRRLEILGHTIVWHGYRIRKVGDKIFELSGGGYGVKITIYEAFGWFHKSYVKSLEKYRIGPWADPDKDMVTAVQTVVEMDAPLNLKILYLAHHRHSYTDGDPQYAVENILTDAEVVQLFKYERNNFTWTEIELIRHYMRLEVKYGPDLMDAIRAPILAAGYKLTNWYGPSALSALVLKAAKIKRTDCPECVVVASQYAYAGGRFEMIRGGHLFDVYSSDKNSAYMAAALELPDLRFGEWRKGKDFEPGKFALYKIRYKSKFDPMRIYPLFRRTDKGMVTWNHDVLGWYWSPEAELVANDPDAEFLEALIFDEDPGVRRPFAFVADMYRLRKRTPDLDKAYKWALASIYGHLARRVGYDKKKNQPPRFHQLEWAGYITSRVRAEMFKVAQQCGDLLVSIDTDSVTAMCPIPVQEGTGLGEWESKHYQHGIFYQNGIYALWKDGEWVEGHARGVSEIRGHGAISPEVMLASIETGEPIKLARRTQYTTFRMALNGVGEAGEWREGNGTEISFGGSGKRKHSKRHTHCSDNIHAFRLRPAKSLLNVPNLLPGESKEEFWVRWNAFAFDPCESKKHLLPWRDKDFDNSIDELRKYAHDVFMAPPKRNADPDDYWVYDLPEYEDPDAIAR